MVRANRAMPATLLLVTALLLSGAGRAQVPGVPAALERARQAIDDERAAEALQILRPLCSMDDASAECLVLLSTAHFMVGDTGAGRAALDRAIEIDPGHRQAWLNRAAVDMAEGLYDQALTSLSKAQEIDPTAADNDLNIGAVLVLKGDIAQASRHFNRYLQQNRSSADAYYLVASNYAIASRQDLALQHLEAATRLDEKSRRRARTDPNFGPMGTWAPFQKLLATDSYRPPPGAHVHRESFDAPYDGSHGQLLRAVLNALQFSGQPFDPDVEVTDQWALVWSDVRLKISNSPSGGGQIEMIAAPNLMSESEWQTRRDTLIGEIRQQLALLTMRRQ